MAETIEKTDLRDYYLSHFETFEQSLNGLKSSELHAERRKAMDQFMETGFPTTDNEDWKYTSTVPILKHTFVPASSTGESIVTKDMLGKYLIKDLPVNLFVFVNGRLIDKLSVRQKGSESLQAENLASVINSNSEVVTKYLSEPANGFNALNKAFLNDGAVIRIPEEVILKDPIHLLFLSGSETEVVLIQPRVFIIAGKNSQAKIIESHHSLTGNAYLFNSVTEVVTEENSVLNYFKIQNESDSAFHISRLQVRQDRASSFNSFA
ncbi:MAG: SufD family Fe-S cluster assembly protein, partial [Syntrophomonadaceae bacterium]